MQQLSRVTSLLDSESKVLSIWNGQDSVDTANENEEVFFALNQTSFYAESGGQVGDTGTFDSDSCSWSCAGLQKTR